ncbi:unnamed protein product [Cuscuta epithymum]|uniref:DUF8039 domain-containing protein n=1 Tax=Cuscuta epithymum TaxID=186058 RepID=A0AAV0CXG4_9ASTE|nr:unnamed protein product [Cuscuta epithymum]
MMEDHLKVSVDTILEQYSSAPLPVPVPAINLSTLGDAQGTFVQWPTCWVKFTSEVMSNKSSKGKKKLDIHKKPTIQRSLVSEKVLLSLTRDCKWLHSMIASRSSDDPIAITLDASMFHYESDDSHALLTIEDISQFLSGAMINISIIQIFVIAMQDYLQGLDTFAQLGWMCPESISSTACESNPEDVKVYIHRAITESQNADIDILVAPYYENVFRNTCAHGSEKVNKIIWKQMKCAKQTGGLECGYYMMRFMYDLSRSINEGQDLEQVYTSTLRDEAFSMAEIHEIRDRWAMYVCDNLL